MVYRVVIIIFKQNPIIKHINSFCLFTFNNYKIFNYKSPKNNNI